MEFRNTIDEKGRLLFPSKLRSDFSENALVVTQGFEHCLMLYTPEEWDKAVANLRAKVSPFNERNRLVLRRFVGPAQKIEFDKSGRISISQSLREYAGLQKECVVLPQISYIEIWDAESYDAYIAKFDDSYASAAEELEIITM